MINNKYKYSDLTSKIIGCAIRVHNAIVNGFQEVIYQRSLAIEMEKEHINFQREFEMPVYFNNHIVGTRRVDFLVNNVIAVELKAISKLEEVHLVQAINYLEAYDLETGLLINFGAKSLEFKRITNNKFRQKYQGNPHIR